jgi:lactoylglutathione lyase
LSTFPIIESDDIDRSAAFYEDAFGFEHKYRFPDQGDVEYVYLERKSSALGIAGGTGRGGFSLCVYVEDVDGTAERLRELGAKELRPPDDQPWGERMASFEDPDGHTMLIMSE